MPTPFPTPPAIVREATPALDAALHEAHRLMEQRRAIARAQEKLAEKKAKLATTKEGKDLNAAREKLKAARAAALDVPEVVSALEDVNRAKKEVAKTPLGQEISALKGRIDLASAGYAEGIGQLAETLERGEGPKDLLDLIEVPDMKKRASGE